MSEAVVGPMCVTYIPVTFFAVGAGGGGALLHLCVAQSHADAQEAV